MDITLLVDGIMRNHDKAEEAYQSLKLGPKKYDEKTHCPQLIRTMSDPQKGTMTAFCKEIGISDSTFYKWIHRYEIFSECYRYGCMISKENWEDEGRNGKDNEMFNMEYWKAIGAARYGLGKSNRIRIAVDSEANPYIQYKQLMAQASMGDFTSGDLKQLMESVNVGTRTYETFAMQKDLDKLREDLLKMDQNRANDSIPAPKSAKIN